jgi:hypothetical protein
VEWLKCRALAYQEDKVLLKAVGMETPNHLPGPGEKNFRTKQKPAQRKGMFFGIISLDGKKCELFGFSFNHQFH